MIVAIIKKKIQISRAPAFPHNSALAGTRFLPDPRARLRAESSCRDGPWLACAYSKGLALGPPWAPGPSGVVSGGFGAFSFESPFRACRLVASRLARVAVTAPLLVRRVQLASGLWGVAAVPLLWRRFTRQVRTRGTVGAHTTTTLVRRH